MNDAGQTTIVHDSIHPSRGGMPGETAFLTAWQDLMAIHEADDEDDGEGPLHGVHGFRWSPNPHQDQADATIAATLVQWLGTNAGACFLAQARRLQAGGLSGREAFIAAWAIANARRQATNSDLRTIETIMIPPDAPRGLDGTPYRAPQITLRQFETAEHVCGWLGSRAGQAFLSEREAEIEAFHAHERARHREGNRTGVRAPQGMTAKGIEDYFLVLRKATAGAGERRGAA